MRHSSLAHLGRFFSGALCGLMLLIMGTGSLWAQSDDRSYQQFADLPPGQVGQMQLARGGPLPGYFQPVELQVPEGAEISLWTGDRFQDFESNRAKAGMLIGGVYRGRITRIPDKPGFEVYPTIEVINRLFPPQGQETRFPIPIQITQEDLERALEGQFVVRVVYLEDPLLALPARQRDGEQRSVDVGPGDDALIAADKLGRPMAIVRIGARVPIEMLQGVSGPGAAPLQLLEEAQPAEAAAPVKQTEYSTPIR